jgi:hypothetical protein
MICCAAKRITVAETCVGIAAISGLILGINAELHESMKGRITPALYPAYLPLLQPAAELPVLRTGL